MSIEVLTGLERKAILSIKKDAVNASVKEELKKYAKKAKIQGFRPGKVPANILEQMYGGKAYEDALNTHLQKNFVNLITEQKLNIVAAPKYDLTNGEGEDFVFAAIFEVMPEIKISDLAALEVEKPVCALTDENVEQTLIRLRKQKASYIDTNKAAENSDKVTIDYTGTIDGVEFDGGSANDYQFVLGMGTMLKEFEDGITGLKPTESKIVKVTFPDNYHAEKFRNKEALFNITLKHVAHEKLPELNEEFIKEVGVKDGNEDALRQEIKDNLHREVLRRLHIKQRENVFNALLKANPLDVPHALVHEEIHHMMENTEKNMKNRGYRQDQIKLTHDMFAHDAKRLVALRLLVQELIKTNNITINDAETKDVVLGMALAYEDPTQYVNWYYSDNARVNNAKAVAMENKVTAYILGLAQTKEVSITYEALMQENI